MLKVEEKMKDKLEQLGYEYYKRSGVWIKYKDWFMETIIFYDYITGGWDGCLAFNNGIIRNREKLEECTEIIKSRYEELERTLEELRND